MNGKVLEYKGMKNNELSLTDLHTRVTIADCYNLTVRLVKLPIVGVSMHNCHNIKVSVLHGTNSSISIFDSCNVSLHFEEASNVHVAEYRCNDIYVDDYRLDGEWMSTLWLI
jgi:hypothetical protein